MSLIVGTEECTVLKVLRVISETDVFALFDMKYQDIGLELGLNSAFLKKLKLDLFLDKDTLKFSIFRLLEGWVSSSGFNAKLVDLIKILKNEALTQCAEALEREFALNSGNNSVIVPRRARVSPNVEYCRPLERWEQFTRDSSAERDLNLNIIFRAVTQDTVFKRDLNNNCTFLHYFLRRGADVRLERLNNIVQYLIDKECATLFNTPGGKYNSTPLQWLMCSLQPEVYTLCSLKDQGVDFNVGDIFQDSTLAYAIDGMRSTGMLLTLIFNKANWKHINLKGESLLHHAARCGHHEALEFFVKAGLDLNAANEDGETPLHHYF